MSWNLLPPPGFLGLREDMPLTTYNRHLPHWRQDGATYFVTFRLQDSLPQAKLRELAHYKSEWERSHPPPRSREGDDELVREQMRWIEKWLDQGFGTCELRSPDVSELAIEALAEADGNDYELDCFVVMPNHVHAILRPLLPATIPLERILQRVKGTSAFKINRRLNRSGTLWQRESFDRIIRDEEHLYRVIQYIGRNPRNAGIAPADARPWIRPSWVELGWRFEES